MPCSYCSVQFTLTKWKSTCIACSNKFCSDCYSGKLCKTCREIQETQFNFDRLMQVKVKELKNYMQFRKINVSPYREKPELVQALLSVEQNKMGNNKSKIRDFRNGNSQSSFHPREQPSSRNYPQQQSSYPSGYYPHPASNVQNSQANPFAPNHPRGFYPHPNGSTTPPNNIFTQNHNNRPTVENESSHSTPTFHPTDDVPPSYGRTQNDFPSASIYVPQTAEHQHSTNINAKPEQQPTTSSTESRHKINVDQPTTKISHENISRPIGTGNGGKIILSNMSSVQQVFLLTNKEMKQILADNFVDYKGCVEKTEFQDKVRALYNDNHKNAKELNQSNDKSDTLSEDQDEKACKICWDATIDCVFLECGHMAACTTCGKKLNECPICRQFIVRCVHVFRT